MYSWSAGTSSCRHSATVTDVFRERDEATREPGADPGYPTSVIRAPPPYPTAVFSRGRSSPAACGSKLDVQFVDLIGFLPGGCDPLLHLWQGHNRLTIGGRYFIQLHVIGKKPGDDRRVHGIGHAECAEQIRSSVRRQAVAPNGGDPIDVVLRAFPDLKARAVSAQVHWQRRAQRAEPRMHFAANRTAVRPGGAVGG